MSLVCCGSPFLAIGWFGAVRVVFPRLLTRDGGVVTAYCLLEFCQPRLHLDDCPLHFTAALALDQNLAIDVLQFTRQPGQRVPSFTIRQLGADVGSPAPERFDASHRMVDGSELRFNLSQQIKLARGQYLCVLL